MRVTFPSSSWLWQGTLWDPLEAVEECVKGALKDAGPRAADSDLLVLGSRALSGK